MREETGTKVFISTVKRVLYRNNLKGRSARRKPLLQNRHKKPDYCLQLHMGTKIVLFGGISSGLMKQKYNCLAIMIIVMFGGKRGMLASRRTPSQPWSTGVAASCCVGCFAAGGTAALHKIDGFMRKENEVHILTQHLKTSIRKLKLGRKCVFQMDNDPKHTFNVAWTTRSRYWSGHHKALTSIL